MWGNLSHYRVGSRPLLGTDAALVAEGRRAYAHLQSYRSDADGSDLKSIAARSAATSKVTDPNPAEAFPSPPPALAPLGHDHGEYYRRWSVDRLRKAETDFAARGGRRFASPDSWEGVSLYQMIIDRFNNGNFSNDRLNIEEFGNSQAKYQETAMQAGLPSWVHGGDFRGIIQRLDYIASLGVEVVFISPPFSHNGGYHGYCVADFTRPDVNFGSMDDFRELVHEVHARGMWLVFDVVINHMCGPSSGKSTQMWPGNGTNAERERCQYARRDADEHGAPFDEKDAGTIQFGDDYFKPLKDDRFYHRCGAFDLDRRSEVGHPGYRFGDFFFGNFAEVDNSCQERLPKAARCSSESNKISMFDFNTNNPDFMVIFTNLLKWWIAEFDVDGLRLDAVPHVTSAFVAYFCTHVRDYALSLGKEHFYVNGEVVGKEEVRRYLNNMKDTNYGKNMSHAFHSIVDGLSPYEGMALRPIYQKHPRAPYPGLDSAYDFEGKDRRGWILKNGIDRVSYVEDRADSRANPINQQVCPYCFQLLSLHDQKRFLAETGGVCEKERLLWSGLFDLLAGSWGMPVIYYGEEQGFTGRCDRVATLTKERIDAGQMSYELISKCKNPGNIDSFFRQDMFVSGPWRLESVVPAIDELAYVGPTWCAKPSVYRWQDDPFLRRDHQAYIYARRLLHLRRSCEVLKKGESELQVNRSHTGGKQCGACLEGSPGVACQNPTNMICYDFISSPLPHCPRGTIMCRGNTQPWPVGSEPLSGVLAYNRVYRGREMVVLINRVGHGDALIPWASLSGRAEYEATYTNVFDRSGREARAVIESGNQVLHFPEGGLKLAEGEGAVYAPVSMVHPFDEELGVALCKDYSPVSAAASGASTLRPPLCAKTVLGAYVDENSVPCTPTLVGGDGEASPTPSETDINNVVASWTPPEFCCALSAKVESVPCSTSAAGARMCKLSLRFDAKQYEAGSRARGARFADKAPMNMWKPPLPEVIFDFEVRCSLMPDTCPPLSRRTTQHPLRLRRHVHPSSSEMSAGRSPC